MSEQKRMGALDLTDEERELLSLELAALLPALSGERKEAYESLAEAVEQNSVPDDLLPLLEGLTKLSLETGRARRIYRAEGERVLTNLFLKTPSGRKFTQTLNDVNKALRTLKGQKIQSVRVGMRTLGHFTVTIEAESVVITLAIRPDSVTVDSVSVGGEAGLG